MILHALRYSVQGVRWGAGPFIVLTTVCKMHRAFVESIP